MLFSSRHDIELLGNLRLRLMDTAQKERTVTRFRTRATGLLLAYLAYYPAVGHEREKLIELFWPDQPPTVGRNKLSLALSALRRVLDPPGSGASGTILADRFTIRLRPEVITTDVGKFQKALNVAAQSREPHVQLKSLVEAVTLYRGELLEPFDDEWVSGERLRLGEQFLGALRDGSRLYESAGDSDNALVWARQAVQADPYREESHRYLIALLLRMRQSEQAREQFLQLRRFKREFGMAPAPETEDLVRHLQIKPEAPPKKGQPDNPLRRAQRSGGATPSVAPLADENRQAAATDILRSRTPLPLRLSRFFGRDAEVSTVLRWLDPGGERLVTLTGMGGVGKTRLAVEVAAKAADRFDAVYFVALAGVGDPEAVPSTIVAALGLSSAPATAPLDQIAACLNALPRTMLVLDNMEQLLTPLPERASTEEPTEKAGIVLFLQELLARVPTLRCLVT
ncbi:MAG: hypothetical protein H7145_03090, partial [Akkermansiaceae bacterium]|nr:hypothetical protein [Armatimonadota bacterium]